MQLSVRPSFVSLIVSCCWFWQYEELAQFAAKVQGLKLSAWEISTCLREIMVETLIARQVEVRLYTKASGLLLAVLASYGCLRAVG